MSDLKANDVVNNGGTGKPVRALPFDRDKYPGQDNVSKIQERIKETQDAVRKLVSINLELIHRLQPARLALESDSKEGWEKDTFASQLRNIVKKTGIASKLGESPESELEMELQTIIDEVERHQQDVTEVIRTLRI